MPIGCMVTLRGDRMYEFFDRLVNVALPRVRDFRGVSSQVVRRARQLYAGREGPVDLPGDRLRQSRQDQGHERDHHHHGADRRRRAGALEEHGDAVPAVGEIELFMATTAKIAKDLKDAEVQVPPPQPLLALRAAARLSAQVRAVPAVLPPARAERRDSRRDQGELVGREDNEC